MARIRNLVLGSEGFVGKPFCEYLESLGETVLRFDIARNPEEDARYTHLPLSECDRVYFLAWDVGGAKYLYEKDSQFRQLDWNLRILINVMPQLQESRVPFLFVSSQLAEEYDTVYGSTKRLGEVWTHLLSGIRVRLWNVYGPLEPPSERTHVISDFIYQALTDGQIKMMTDGEERRQFIHISDVCRGLYCAMEQNLNEVCDITSFEWVRVKDVAGIISTLTGAPVVPGEKKGTTPITPIRGRVPDWFPQVGLKKGLSEMVRTFQAR